MGIVIKRYIWVLSLVFVLILSYILARVTSLAIAGYFPEENFSTASSDPRLAMFQDANTEVDVEAIIKRNFFDAQESTFENVQPTETIEEPTDVEMPVQTDGVAVKTTLPVNLISTISFGNGEDPLSSCVLAASGQAKVYGVGEALGFPQTKLIRILPMRIEFSNKGRLEFAEFTDAEVKTLATLDAPVVTSVEPDEEPTEDAEPTEDGEENKGIEQDGNHFRIKKSLVQEAMTQPEKLLTQMRALPYTDANGKKGGYKFYKVSNKSIFYDLGIRRGDVVLSINGKVLDQQSGMQTFAELKDASNFEMVVIRKSVEQKFTYELVE